MLFSSPLKDSRVFNKCFKSGVFCSDKFITCYFMPNNSPSNRIGISVSKKVGNAVARNRAKRIIRAAYRSNESKFPIGLDVVFVARQGVAELKTQDIEEFFDRRLFDAMSKAAENGYKKSSKKSGAKNTKTCDKNERQK